MSFSIFKLKSIRKIDTDASSIKINIARKISIGKQGMHPLPFTFSLH
jgi:hypothetical protein